ncbi:MAG: hypothetical protein J2P36_12865 [Ktedonobacteraceae bacterium]|nr:hypothetical protein [Ktedonobacteraceae bacterium]
MSSIFSEPGRLKQLLILCVSVLVVIILVGLSISFFGGMGNNTQNTHQNPTKSPAAVSPFLFGTNIDLLNSKNPALTSPEVKHSLENLHLHVVRIPVRANASDAAVKEAVDYVVNDLEALPLLNLRGLSGPDALKNQARIVKAAKQIAGNKEVDYEYGNEDDLSGLSAEQYAATWNQLVPALKQLEPQARVIGPATYHYNGDFLGTFLQQAHPLPDAVSWHEYTCDDSASKDQCLQHINDWKQHADAARQVMKNTMGKPLPIMITEWNYAPNASPQDSKSSDDNFVSNWTNRALMGMVQAGIYASMQFSATDSAMALVNDDGTLTTQGETLQQVYEDLAPKQTSSAPEETPTTTAIADVTPTPTPTPRPKPTQAPPKVQQPAPTPTPTPIHVPSDPTGIYNLATSGQPMYASSLAAQDSGNWDILNFTDGGYCKFVSSGYHAYEPSANYYAPCMSRKTYPADFALQVSMTISKGNSGGIIVRADNTSGYNNQYRLRIGSDGSYDLVNLQSSMVSGSSGVIKTGAGQTNVVTIVGYKTTLYIYINKTFVKSVPNATRHSGQIGFFAVDWGSATEVVYKNLKVWQLNWP